MHFNILYIFYVNIFRILKVQSWVENPQPKVRGWLPTQPTSPNATNRLSWVTYKKEQEQKDYDSLSLNAYDGIHLT